MKPEEIKNLKYALPVCLVKKNAEASTFHFLSIFTYFELSGFWFPQSPRMMIRFVLLFLTAYLLITFTMSPNQ